MEDSFEQSEVISAVIQNRVIFPAMLNDRACLFGGELLKWLDETAYIAAKNYTGQDMVTTHIRDVHFILPFHSGDTVLIKAEIRSISASRLEILVTADKRDCGRQLTRAAEGLFFFAALNGQGAPVRMQTAG